MYWLAEQGLAPKSIFLVIIPLLFLIIINLSEMVEKEMKQMSNNRLKMLDVLTVPLKAIYDLCGNIAGGALLTNTS